jgi:hypothetical protein
MLIGLAEPGRLLPAGPTATRRVLSLLALTVAAAWLAAQPTQDLAHGNAPVYEPQTAALVSAKIDALYGQPPELPADHESTGMARRRSSPCGSAPSRSPRRRSTCTPT